MRGTRTSGIWPAPNQQFAMNYRGKQQQQNLVQGCGRIRDPNQEAGIKVLGALVGHRDFMRKHLENVLEQHEVLLQAIPGVPDLQSAWLFLLHCASARANYHLRVVRPEMVLEFALAHDENMWRGLCRILEVPANACSRIARDVSSLPLSLGGLGLRSAFRTRVSAFWASWADTLPMVQNRHPHIADVMVCHLEGVTQSPCLAAASSAAAELDDLDWEVPQWSALAAGLRPLPSQSTKSRGLRGMVGSTKHQFAWSGDFGKPQCSPGWTNDRGPWSDHKQDPMLVWPFRHAPLSLLCFGSCSSAASPFPFPCLIACAGVAFQTTHLATTAPHAPGQGCWEGEGFLLRVRQPEFVEKLEDGWQPTCSCGTWTSVCLILRQSSPGGGGRWTSSFRRSPTRS